jgi:hypothetical protein
MGGLLLPESSPESSPVDPSSPEPEPHWPEEGEKQVLLLAVSQQQTDAPSHSPLQSLSCEHEPLVPVLSVPLLVPLPLEPPLLVEASTLEVVGVFVFENALWLGSDEPQAATNARAPT